MSRSPTTTTGIGRALRAALHNYGKLVPNGSTNRVGFVRKATRKAVEDRTPWTADGRFIDENTNLPIDGPYHLGHRPGQGWRKTQAQAREEGWSRRQLIEHQNNPDIYVIEDPISNMSHQHEMP